MEGTVEVVKSYIYLLLATITALALLLFGTNPRSINSVALVAPFVLIFLLLFLLASSFFHSKGFARKTSWVIAAFVAVLPTLLLVLQSIGQLTIRDVATIAALFAIAYFYVTRVGGPIGN
jgi:hypothetical protein